MRPRAPWTACLPQIRLCAPRRIEIAMDRGDFAVAESLLAEGEARPSIWLGSAASSPLGATMARRPYNTSAPHSPLTRATAWRFPVSARPSAWSATPARPNRTSMPPAATMHSGAWLPGPQPAKVKETRRCLINWGWHAPPLADSRRRARGSGWPLTATRSTPTASGLSLRWSTKKPRQTNMRRVFYIFYRFLLQARCDYHIIAGVHSVVVHFASRSPERQTFERLVDR